MMGNTCSGEKFFAFVTFFFPNGQKMKAMPNPDILCSDAGVPVRIGPLPRPEVAAARSCRCGVFSPAAQIFRNNKLDASFFSLAEEIKHRYCKRMDPCWSKDQAWPSKRMRCCNTNSGLKAFTNVDNNQLAYNCWDAGENTCIGVCGLRCEIMNDGENLQRRKSL